MSDTTSTSTPSASPAAGWYPDPQTPAQDRWWDGAAWGEQRRAQAGAPVAATASAPAVVGYGATPLATPVGTPVGTPAAGQVTGSGVYVGPGNTAAIVGLVLALTGVIVPAGILTLVGGIISIVGLRRAKQLSNAGFRPIGRGPAIAGIIVGFALTVLAIFAIVAIVIGIASTASQFNNLNTSDFGDLSGLLGLLGG